jgi:hypothetical protein
MKDDSLNDITFSLNKFRTQVMKLSIEEFKECYGIEKNGIGKKCKLHIRTSLNNHNWMAIENTSEFHDLILNEYKTKKKNKSWVSDRTLKVHISMGKAKSGEAFKDENDADFYLDLNTGDALDFSQEDAQSPRVKLNSAEMNVITRSLPVQAKKMILRMYTKQASKLYHGFLWDHLDKIVAVVIRMSNVNLNSNGASEIRSLLQSESDESILSDATVDSMLLDLRLSLSSAPESEFPSKGKYPPLAGVDPPRLPTLLQWKHHQHPTQPGTNEFKGNPFASVFSSMFNSVLVPKESTEEPSSQTVNVVTFSYENRQSSVPVINDLTLSTTMLSILKKTRLYNLLLGGVDGYDFKVAHESGFYIYQGADFAEMNVGLLLQMELVKRPLHVMIEWDES